MIELSEKRLIGPVIRLHSNDNVVVARVDVPIGMTFETDMAGERIAPLRDVEGQPAPYFALVLIPGRKDR